MISSKYASKIRMVVRSTLVVVTAFGLKLSAEQVASIQLFSEAVLSLVVVDA